MVMMDFCRSAIFCLLFKGDTVLLASSRAAMEHKLRLLADSARDIGMVMHPEKSQYMAVNTTDTDPFVVNDIRIVQSYKEVLLFRSRYTH